MAKYQKRFILITNNNNNNNMKNFFKFIFGTLIVHINSFCGIMLDYPFSCAGEIDFLVGYSSVQLSFFNKKGFEVLKRDNNDFYFSTKNKSYYFCDRKLRKALGFIPNEIYYKLSK